AEFKWRAAGASDGQVRTLRAALERRRGPKTVKRVVMDFDLDGWGVRRYAELTPGGAVMFEAQNEDFRQVPGRTLRLPWRSRIAIYADDEFVFSEAMVTGTLRVDSIDVSEPPPATFTLNYTKPGTEIIDNLSGRSVNYEIPAAPTDLERAIRDARG